MAEPFHILGVHPINASQPCYLIEAAIGEPIEAFDWGSVTQEDVDQPRANWQVAYDERPLNQERSRWAFFFHYPDFSKPLLTPVGPLKLPTPSPLPEHLQQIEYAEP